MTLYQESARKATGVLGPKADSTSFLGLTPGTKYKVEVTSWAGPLHTAAANVSAWTCEWGVKGVGGGGPWTHWLHSIPFLSSGLAPGAWLTSAFSPQTHSLPVSCSCPCSQAVLWFTWPGPAVLWGKGHAMPNSQMLDTSHGSGRCP